MSTGARMGRSGSSRFAIPMRGNETGGAGTGALAYAVFAIPMRGNELDFVLTMLLCAVLVCNPHEG